MFESRRFYLVSVGVWALLTVVVCLYSYRQASEIQSETVVMSGRVQTLETELKELTRRFDRIRTNNGSITSDDRPRVRFVFGIKTGGDAGFRRRPLVRETLVQNLKKRNDTATFFAISRHVNADDRARVEQEFIEHNDVALFGHLDERYQNLALKTMALVQHAYATYKFDYLFLLDDDTFFNPYLLDYFHEQFFQPQLYFAGSSIVGSRIVTDPTSRNYEPTYRDCDHYPPYVSGGTVILSYDLARWIATSTLTLRLLANEDVSMGVWLAALDKARPKHLDGIAMRWRLDADGTEFLQSPMKFFMVKDVDEATEYRRYWDLTVSSAKNYDFSKRPLPLYKR